MKLETVIGLEVHIELKTESKIFSPSPNYFGAEPNTKINVIDLGYPGVLPVVNKKVVEYAIKAALALNCEIAEFTKFDRKNYFYPDNPKAYQISQYDQPIGKNGWIELELDGQKKRIGINRIHLEEDAGKLTHLEGYSLIDFNRQGTPLIEIVSEPDIRTPEEAYAYLEQLKSIIQYTGVSDCKMEEGSLRCDANISLRPFGSKKLGTKSELKNLNSFHYVKKGLEFEEKRQKDLLSAGMVLQQETRRYDEASNTTKLMRIKENTDDYRYFTEPDLVSIHIDQEWKERIASGLPELPPQRRKRYTEEWELTAYAAKILTLTREMSDFFDATVLAGANPKQAANWLMGEVSAKLNTLQMELNETKLTPVSLAGMIQLIENGKISSTIAKQILEELIQKGGEAELIVKEKGFLQISDEAVILKLIHEVLDKHPQSVVDYKNGKDRALGFLVGQMMKKTKGQANPSLVNQLLLKEMNKKE